ncbi:MAG: HDIG domain-containing metalloprotein [Candidatus Omnitrophota bacterium]
MKNQTAIKTKLRYLAGVLVVFALSYILRINFIIPLFLILLAAYYLSLLPAPQDRGICLLNLSLLFVIIFTASYLIVKNGWSVYYIPFSAVPMLATLLFGNLWVSFLLALASGISVGSLAGMHYYLAVIFLISGIVSSLLVLGARRRMAIIRAGFITGLVQMLSVLLVDRFLPADPSKYIILMVNGLASSILVLGILPFFEYLFRTVTDISLLELADFDHPLLKRMIMEAPGTYHHSLIVGNLSEAACQAIGAHALLARIGAYYHDIGKLYKPDYFTENQDVINSRHENLAPTISKMVIMNHVKEGEELARKHKLNPRLVEFILQHHGTSLVYFFYRRALENPQEQQEVSEEGFRYPGPKPSTKEAAVVLLADSVEAAMRSLKDPSAPKIEELVHRIINNKFIDGQLDSCDLTLKDLEKISAVFIRILSGIYHSRVTYPEGPNH